MVNLELKTKSVQHRTGTEGRNSGSFPAGKSCSSTFLFSLLSRWNRHLDYGILYLAKLLHCSREEKINLFTISPHRQVARLLQIQSVEKICKKFVTHKINLDNCLGKSIHNYKKNLDSGRFCLADSFIGWTDASKSLFTFIEVNIARCDDKDKFVD